MRFFATCAKGTEGALRRELGALKLHAVRGEHGGVSFEGKLEAGMLACLHSRVAMRVLLELVRYPAEDATSLYDGARAVPWADWLTDRSTLAVEATVKDAPALSHSGFAALKVKDAVVDALRDRLGARPDVDPKDPDVRVVLHLAGGEATLALDLAGEPLHRRGYRAVTGVAPLKETLAAAVLSLGGVDPERPFLDPMCGSATLVIEQAQRARRIAPGLSRPMGFQRWPAYRGGPQSAWDRMKEAARAEILARAPAPISARDLHPKALEAARRNLAAAGVAADVALAAGDAREIDPAQGYGEGGTVCTNPPYGERLAGRGEEGEGPARGRPDTSRTTGTTVGTTVPDIRRTTVPDIGREARARGKRRQADRGVDRGDRGAGQQQAVPAVPEDRREMANRRRKLEGLYRGLAEAVLRFHGWQAVFLSGNPLLERAFPWKPAVVHRLWNGPIEARLLKYRIG